MSARELFEKIGYKQTKHNIFDEEIKPNEFITQDEPYINYRDENEIGIEEIEFRFYSKRVWIYAFDKRTNCRIHAPLNYQEILAIQKQIEELGWNNVNITN